jgi:outer membrane biosynthesis protein TonB
MRGIGRGRRRVVAERSSAMRACAVTLLAAAGFGLAASSHAFGSPSQTEPEPTTTAPPPDPAPTTVPRPDPAPPPPPVPRPRPQPQPVSPPPPPPPPPPAPSASPPAPVAPVTSVSAPKPSRADQRQAPRRRSRPAPLQPAREERVGLTPTIAALRIGERLRGYEEVARSRVAGARFVRAPTPAAAAVTDAPSAPFVPSLAILAALGLGTMLLAFSAVPDVILARGPRGVSFVRARVEVGLMGGAIVALVAAVYFVGASS